MALLLFLFTFAHANSYDWIKTRVNTFWYNQYFERCTPDSSNKNLKFTPTSTTHCSRLTLIENETPELSSELKEATFFDAALNDQALENQCQFDYWNRLSIKQPSENESVQKLANQKLRSQFTNLKTNLKDFTDPTQNEESTKEAQKQIIAQLTEQSLQIAGLRREINKIAATNPIFSGSPNNKSKDKILQLENQIKVIESSMIFSEDQTVKDYITMTILPKINDYYKVGKQPNLAELQDYFLNDNSESFQKRVVEVKLKSTSQQQATYAKIDGNYKDNYNFKVQSIQNGAGARMLQKNENQNNEFSSLQCELESKYGKGEKAADATNTAIISGVTVFFGGATFALAKLSQVGMVSLRAAKLASSLSSAVSGTISATMLAEGITNACFENQFGKTDQAICSRSEEQTQKGLKEQIASEVVQSKCLRDLGLAALAGIVSYKSFVNAQRLQRENQLIDLGVKSKYDEIISNLNKNTDLAKSDKTKIINELNKSVKFSTQEGFPRDGFIQAMAKDNPEDLYMALKQINNEQAGKTWPEKVKKWLERNGIKGQDAKEMEACLIDQGDKVVSYCPFEKSHHKFKL